MQDLKVIIQGKKKRHTELCSNYIVVKVVVKSALEDYRSPLNSSKTKAKRKRNRQTEKERQEQSISAVR